MAIASWLLLILGLISTITVHGYVPIGCYIDNGERDLAGLVESSGSMSPRRCNELCNARKFLFFGLQATNECWCGNSYGRHGVASPADCNKRCPGDNSATCGSDWRNNVYATDYSGSIQIRYIGCFLDSTDRDLPVLVAQDSAITFTKCNDLCRARNYIYFGLQFANECWCGNDYGKHGARPERECDKRCTGESGALCGGSLRNSVYATGHRFLPLPASNDPIPAQLRASLASSIKSMQVPFPSGVMCATCLMASWNRQYCDVKTRVFAMKDIRTVMKDYPSKVSEKVLSLQFGSQTTFEDFQMQIFGNYAVRGYYMGIARRVGDNVEMGVVTSEVVTYLVPKHSVFEKKSCSGFWFWTKCNTETIRERLGYSLSDIELIDQALRSETFRLSAQKLG